MSASCENCNDCKDLVTKSILVQDASGNNLLFGNTAIYEPADISLTANTNTVLFFLANPQTGAIEFGLEDDVGEYTLILNQNTTENLSFDLAARNSERCCGTQTFSTATRLNNAEISNDDTIVIVK